MTTIVFESGTIVDAVKKAARVAPSKSGTSFDQAWGILMQITPGDEVKCLMRANNLDVFYSSVVDCITAEGDSAVWRLPSQILQLVMDGVPVSSGHQVKFEMVGAKVKITSGRLSATLNLGDASYYSEWDLFDPDNMSTVSGLGGRLAMVEWAADTGSHPPFCGVWVDGEYLSATDRIKLTRVPMKVEVPQPIVIPAGILGSGLLHPMGDVELAVSESRLLLMTDEYTQIETVLYDANVPDTSHIARTDYPVMVEVPKAQILGMMTRAAGFAKSDRDAKVELFLGREEIAASMQNEGVGMFGDVLPLPGKIDHKRVKIGFGPKHISDAISKAPGDRVKLGYDPDATHRFFYIEGDSGYQCWVAPRKNHGA